MWESCITVRVRIQSRARGLIYPVAQEGEWVAFIGEGNRNVLQFKNEKQQSTDIIIHQTHCEKSDWPRVFNQFTIACELDMINAISAADIAFIMSSSTSAWLLSPLKWMAECFASISGDELCEKCITKQSLTILPRRFFTRSRPFVRIWSVARVCKKYGCFAV